MPGEKPAEQKTYLNKLNPVRAWALGLETRIHLRELLPSLLPASP